MLIETQRMRSDRSDRTSDPHQTFSNREVNLSRCTPNSPVCICNYAGNLIHARRVRTNMALSHAHAADIDRLRGRYPVLVTEDELGRAAA